MVRQATLPAGPLLDDSLGDEPLAAEPPAPTGALIGYARVSTGGQRLDRQLAALNSAGCARIFADKKSGKNAEREELWKALDYLRPGDTLVVPSLDRLGRSLADLIAIVAGLRKRGIGFHSLHENIDTTTPGGRLVFHVFCALAEFIRELIVQGTNEGLAAARARGVRLGRPPAMTPEQIRSARALLAQPDATVSSIARLLGVSRSTIYKYVPELTDGDRQTIEPPAAQAELAALPQSIPVLQGAVQDSEPVDVEELLAAAELIITTQKASTSMLQRRRRIGFNHAARLMEALHQHGIVGHARGSRARLVLVPADQLQPTLDALRTRASSTTPQGGQG